MYFMHQAEHKIKIQNVNGAYQNYKLIFCDISNHDKFKVGSNVIPMISKSDRIGRFDRFNRQPPSFPIQTTVKNRLSHQIGQNQ